MANLSAVLYGKQDIKIDEQPIKEPGPGEVRLSVRDVGICGSDVHMYMNGSHGTHQVHGPNVIGHEASGVVTKVGANVTKLKVGDRVTLEPGDACGECKNCLRSVHNMCLVERGYAGEGFEGFIVQQKTMKAAYCHKLPDNVSDEEGAFMEPLAVAVQDCRRGGVQAGQSVLVLGAGSIGLLCMMTAKAMGATNVCITDVVESRLTLAKELGATHTLLTTSLDHDTVVKQIHELMGEAPDVTLECSGIQWCQQLAFLTTIPAGCVVIIGYGAAESTLPLAVATQRQIDIRPSWRYDKFCYAIAIDLVSCGKVQVAPLITHRYSLQQTDAAIKMAASMSPGVLKVMIKCNEK